MRNEKNPASQYSLRFVLQVATATATPVFVSCIHLTPPAAASSSKLKLGSSRQAISFRAAPIIHRQRRWPPNRKPPVKQNNQVGKLFGAERHKTAASGRRASLSRPSFLLAFIASYYVPRVQDSAKGTGRSRSSRPKVSLELLRAARQPKGKLLLNHMR